MKRTRITNWLFLLVVCVLPHTAFALSLLKTANVSFGMSDYQTPLTGTISLGTNGVILYTGSFTGDGLGVPAQVELQDTVGTTLEIACETGTLAHPNGAQLPMTATAVVGTSQTGNWNTTTPCVDLSTPILVHTIVAGTPDNVLYVGGQLAPTAITAGTYSTGETNGQDIQIRVVVQ